MPGLHLDCEPWSFTIWLFINTMPEPRKSPCTYPGNPICHRPSTLTAPLSMVQRKSCFELYMVHALSYCASFALGLSMRQPAFLSRCTFNPVRLLQAFVPDADRLATLHLHPYRRGMISNKNVTYPSARQCLSITGLTNQPKETKIMVVLKGDEYTEEGYYVSRAHACRTVV